MRSIDEVGLREMVKESFRGRSNSSLKNGEPVVYKGATIPVGAEIFFPKGRNNRRSHKHAIIYIRDYGGSVVCIFPEKIQVRLRTGETMRVGSAARSTKSQSIPGRMYNFT